MELLPWLVIEEHLLSALDGLGEFGSILILSSCSPTRVMVFTAGVALIIAIEFSALLSPPKSFGVGACDLSETGLSGTWRVAVQVGRLGSTDFESTILVQGLFDFVQAGVE